MEGIEEIPKEETISKEDLLRDSPSQLITKVEEEESEDMNNDEA